MPSLMLYTFLPSSGLYERSLGWYYIQPGRQMYYIQPGRQMAVDVIIFYLGTRFSVLIGPFRRVHSAFAHYSPADESHKVAETGLERERELNALIKTLLSITKTRIKTLKFMHLGSYIVCFTHYILICTGSFLIIK